jgi:hypothetical protein
MLRRWLSAAVVVVFGCSLLNEDRGPKLDCAQNPQARACANGVLGACQNGQVAYEICTDEGRFCNVVDGEPVCGTCQPSCAGKSCGDDGCGGVCGTCPMGAACNAQGACFSCTPNCTGKTCGDDGCGGSCGACPTGSGCSDKKQCVVGCNCSAGQVCQTTWCDNVMDTRCITPPACNTCSATSTCLPYDDQTSMPQNWCCRQ